MMKTYWWLVVCSVLGLATSAANAMYYYYGVGDNEGWHDNDVMWDALSECGNWSLDYAELYDNRDACDGNVSDARDSIYDDINYYANTLQDGDVFMFFYQGHGGANAPDIYGRDGYEKGDEGTTALPTTGDPTPGDTSFAGDEFFGWSGSTYYLWDDDLTNAMADFAPGVTVIVINGACHSGGLIGGSYDIDNSAPALNNGLYTILAAPEASLSIGINYGLTDATKGAAWEALLTTALSNTVAYADSMDSWYSAAMNFGSTHGFLIQRSWDSTAQPYYFWPTLDWTPSEYENTYFTDHWGWEETYLQLTPVAYSTLDEAHDYAINPEPGTVALMLIGIAGIIVRRRKKAA